MKFSLSKLYFRYTTLTALVIRQEVEHIMANVFYLTFLNVFYSCHVFYFFLTFFFYFSWNVFYIYGSNDLVR